MNVMKALVVVGVAVAAMVLWDTYKPEGGLKEMADHVSDSVKPSSAASGGFVDIPMPDGMSARGVVIFAPENCPSDAAQRAQRLASLLSSQGIAYRRATAADYSNLASQDEANRVMAVMNAPIPIVYVNGRAKSNPEPDEVVAEYRRGRSG
jgi:hypothetical protein